MADLDLATIATFSVRHQAEIARASLEAAGIRALVQADDEGGLNPGFYAQYGVRVLVKREDLADAFALLGPDFVRSVLVDAQHLDAVVAHAAYCAPEEGCGLLAFDAPGSLAFVYALTNADRSPHRFTVDPGEQYHAIRHAERNGWDIGGSFHSHPGGRAAPSRTDIAELLASDWVHFIAGRGRDGSAEVRAYRISSGSAEELSIVVASR